MGSIGLRREGLEATRTATAIALATLNAIFNSSVTTLISAANGQTLLVDDLELET